MSATWGIKKNSIMAISPYRWNGWWVFDDDKAGLVREPFVGGADEIIDRLVGKLPHPEKGFLLLFSAGKFPKSTELKWVAEQDGGNVYECKTFNMRGRLCPALFKYFPEAPASIFVQACARA